MLFFKKSSKHLENVFRVTFFCSSRRLQDMFAKCLPTMSSRSLEDFFKKFSQNFFKTSWRCLQRNIFSFSKTSCEDVLKMSSRHVCKTSSKTSSRLLQELFPTRRLQYVFKTSSRRYLAILPWGHDETIVKTSWKTKNVTLKTPSRQDVFSASSQKQIFVWNYQSIVTEGYSDPCKSSKMEHFVKIING